MVKLVKTLLDKMVFGSKCNVYFSQSTFFLWKKFTMGKVVIGKLVATQLGTHFCRVGRTGQILIISMSMVIINNIL